MFELVVIWNGGERDVYACPNRVEAEAMFGIYYRMPKVKDVFYKKLAIN